MEQQSDIQNRNRMSNMLLDHSMIRNLGHNNMYPLHPILQPNRHHIDPTTVVPILSNIQEITRTTPDTLWDIMISYNICVMNNKNANCPRLNHNNNYNYNNTKL
jgi:hypothetical protein